MRRLISLLALLAALSPVAAQSFREKVSVELVRVELLATDTGGRPLHDLGKPEIRILVDGRSVPVEGFEPPAPGLPALPSAPPPLPLAARQLPTPKATETPAPVSGPESPSRYLMAFLSDETSSEQSNRKAVYAELFHFFERGLAPGVEVQLMRFDGRLRVECPWTSDADRLRRTVAAMAKRGAAPRIGAPGSFSDNPEQGAYRLELDAMEARVRVRSSLAGLFDALRTFPETPGRKALYFVSDGAPFLAPTEIARDLIATSTSSTDPSDPSQQRRRELEAQADSDLLWDSLSWSRSASASILTDISRLALLREIEIHPVRAAAHDLSGRVRTDRAFRSRARADSSLVDLRTRSQRDAMTVPTTDIAAGQGMEAIAEATGGDAVLSRRFIEDGLKREVEYPGEAYIVTFRDPFPGDHRFHRIEIATTRKGASLRYRRGYRVLDTGEALLQSAANRLYLRSDANPLGVRLDIESLGTETGQAGAKITVAYPAPPRAGGAAAQDDAMRIVGFCAVKDGVLRHLDLSGKAETLESGGATWLTRSGRISLKPGAYRWSLAIRDETTGITSYLTFDRALP